MKVFALPRLDSIPIPSPLTIAAGSLVAGVLAQQTFDLGLITLCVFILAAIVIFLASLLASLAGTNTDLRPLRFSATRIVSWLSLAAALIGLGALWTEYRGQTRLTGIGNFAHHLSDPTGGQLVRLRGVIRSIHRGPTNPQVSHFDAIQRGERTSFTISVQQIESGSAWQESQGQVLAYLESPVPDDLDDPSSFPTRVSAPSAPTLSANDFRVGEIVEVLGWLTLPAPPHNPGQFDFRQWLLSSGYQGQINLNSTASIQVIAESQTILSWGDRLKDHFKFIVGKHVTASQQDLAAAILLGDRSLIDRTDRETFAATGTVHILAISGLHLGILAASILLLGRFSYHTRIASLLIVMILVVFYAWLVEFRAPIVRAAVLTTLYCLASLLRREAFSLNSLALAMIVVFALDPTQLFQPGTHLSFLAVASIIVYSKIRSTPEQDQLQQLKQSQQPKWKQRWGYVALSIREAYTISAVVFFACLPLVIHSFHLCAWVGLLINPLVIPPMSIALLSGFLLLIFGDWLPGAGHIFGWVCSQSLAIVDHLVLWAHQIPGGHQWVASPGSFWIVCWYIWLILSLWLLQGFHRKWIALSGAVLILIAAFLFPSPAFPDRIPAHRPGLTITFADVGHGNCIFIRTPENHTILYDVGSFPSSRVSGDRCCQLLWSYGLNQVDQLLISHADIDHYNGVPEVISKFDVQQVITPHCIFESLSPAVQELQRRVLATDILVSEVATGDVIWQEPDLKCTVVSPGVVPFSDSDNSNSLVLLIQYREARVLLTADLEGEGLNALLATPSSGFSVLQIPHHGSAASQPKRLAAWADARIAVASALEKRVPEKTREAYQEHCQEVHITQSQGAVLVNIQPDGSIQTRTWLANPWPIR